MINTLLMTMLYDKKSEGSFSVPFMGSLLRALQCIPVARSDAKSRKAALDVMQERYTLLCPGQVRDITI